jgi:MYXO-CTERM domain-containing protein
MKKMPALLFSLLALTLLPAALSAQEAKRAAVVVRFADDRVETACVAFTEEEIDGYTVLERAGLSVEANFTGMGGAVCRIADTGCPAADCWCQCRGGGECTYWSYWQQAAGEWRYATAGFSGSRLGDGAIEGWSWGPGSVTEAIEPPSLTFAEVCSAAAIGTVTPAATAGDQPAGGPTLLYFAVALAALLLLALAGRLRRRPA